MKTSMRWRCALWAVVLAGAFWGLVGAGPVPAYAQRSSTDAGATSLSDQGIAYVVWRED
jgi:hypothetical protein